MPSGSREDDKLISIITVNNNPGSLLSRTVRSNLDSNYTANWIELVLDDDNNPQNTSLDNFQANLENRLTIPSNQVIIRNDENEEWCKTINIGLAKTQADIIIFSNSDVVNSTDAITKKTWHLNSNNELRIYQFSLLLRFGEPEVLATYLDPLGYACNFMVNRAILVSFDKTVAIAVKHNVMNRVGISLPDYFMEYEDQVFWGALLYGFKILSALDAIAQHYRGKCEKPVYFIRERRVYLYTTNHIFTINNLQLHNRLHFLLQIFFIKLLEALLALVAKRNFTLSLKIVDGIGALFQLLRSRRKNSAKLRLRSISIKEVLKYFEPFMPLRQLNYLTHQEAGKRHLFNNQVLLKILAAKGMMC